MNLILVSQDKKSIWDFSQCYIFIPSDSIHEICIRPYAAPNGVVLAAYEDPTKAEEVLQEIINAFGKSKLLLTPQTRLHLEDLEAAKKYFDNLNEEKFIVSDNKFKIEPIGNGYTITYQLPPDEVKK